MRNLPNFFFKMLNRYLSIKIDVDWATFWDSLIAFCYCMVHSVVNKSGLSSVGLKKKLIVDFFLFCFLNCFQEEVQYRHFTSKLSTYFSRDQIFEKFIWVWGLLDQWGTTRAPHRDISLKLGSEKNVFKTVNS